MIAEVHHLESNDYTDWSDFERYESPDPYDDFGWFHVTIGASGIKGGNDFQVCVATPRGLCASSDKGSVLLLVHRILPQKAIGVE